MCYPTYRKEIIHVGYFVSPLRRDTQTEVTNSVRVAEVTDSVRVTEVTNSVRVSEVTNSVRIAEVTGSG